MWSKGLNWVKTGIKRAHFTCLSIPNGPRCILEKGIFDPFFTLFCSQSGPFSRHFGIFHGPKRITTGSKRAKNTCLSMPNGLGSLLEKRVFDPFFVPKQPIFKAFWDFPWAKTRPHGLPNPSFEPETHRWHPGDGGAKLGGALPKPRILCPKAAFFGPKRP